MSRSQLIFLIAGLAEALVGAYFVMLAAKPEPVARILLRRGYEQRGWTELRLARRIRLIGVVGAVLALAAIVLAIVKFVR